MARLAVWAFDQPPGSAVAVDSENKDGSSQNGVFQNGATTNGSGSAVFDGNNDYVEIPYDPVFDLDSGSISISFTQDTASAGNNPWGGSAAQTLFSRDSSGYDGGGHLTIFIKSDGSVGVRHQDTSSSYNFEGGNVTLGQPTEVVYSWSPSGSQLIVDGIVVDTGADALTLAGNSEPITIGASQAQSGNSTANNLQGHFDGQIHEVAIFDAPAQGGAVPCLTRGTLIRTPVGDVAIERLRVGDLVCTLHSGPQRIRWIGSRLIDLRTSFDAKDKLRPVRITAGALGSGLPKRDLLVSRQHRMLISSRIAKRMFDSESVLAAAIKLTAMPGIFADGSACEVEYFHLLLDRHEVIFAENAPTESLCLADEAMKALSPSARQEILTLFPERARDSHVVPRAVPIPYGRSLKQLIRRHSKNNKPLLETFAVAKGIDRPTQHRHESDPSLRL